MRRRWHTGRAVRIGTLAAALVPGLAPRADAARVTVEPTRLEVSTFSGQRTIRIVAHVTPGNLPIIVVRGPDIEEIFNEKVRFGPIWINSGHVRVSGAPALLLSLATHPLDELVGAEDIRVRQLDARAVPACLRIEPRTADRPDVRNSYLALKTSDGSFRALDGTRAQIRPGDTPGTFTVDLPWPTRARPGTYTITAYECCERQVIEAQSAVLEVAQVGLSAWLAEAATRHAAVYGTVAVGVAMSLGFGIDFLVSWTSHRRARRSRAGSGRPTPHSAGNRVATTDQVRR